MGIKVETHSPREENWRLRDDRNSRPQGAQVDSFHVKAVHVDAAHCRVQSQQHVQQRSLPRPRPTHDSNLKVFHVTIVEILLISHLFAGAYP